MRHEHTVEVYYEDTDHSGVVYYANYLKFFERAREHAIGRRELVRLADEEGLGFAVYRVEATYKAGARFGDTLVVRSEVSADSAYRLLFLQDVHRGDELLVKGRVELVCLHRDRGLVPIPDAVLRHVGT